MADFINDPHAYADRRAFYKAQCAFTVFLMDKAREAQLEALNTFNERDQAAFHQRCNGLLIAPSDAQAAARERTALHRASPDETLAIQQQHANDRAAFSEQWLRSKYCASKPLLAPLDTHEIHRLVSKLRPCDAKCLASDELACDHCMVWQGMMNNGKPMLERRRSKEQRAKKRKRVVGSAAEVLYNFWRTPLQPRQRLKRSCVKPMCVNPFHYT